jgi:hypothetical protein
MSGVAAAVDEERRRSADATVHTGVEVGFDLVAVRLCRVTDHGVAGKPEQFGIACQVAVPEPVLNHSPGQVRLVFRNFPLADVHPFALTAALAAEAAAALGAFWPMHDLLFSNISATNAGRAAAQYGHS